MKIKLSKRQREWVWAVIAIVVIVGGLAWWWSTLPVLPPSIITDTNHYSPTGSLSTKDMSVNSVIRNLPDATTFAGYFSAISGEVKGGGPYTIFVPVNSAFTNLPQGSVSELSSAARKRLLEYHVVASKIDADALKSGSKTTLSRDVLNFEVNLQTGATYVGNGKVLGTYPASNGIVYTISAVNFPPK